ncbi:hypothetical protein MMC27_000537 [Xylographa pallens]|nr:hypothetical protein [Xylographa pallens]
MLQLTRPGKSQPPPPPPPPGPPPAPARTPSRTPSLSNPASDAFLYYLGTNPLDKEGYPFTAVTDCCQVRGAYDPFPNASGSRRQDCCYRNCIGWVSVVNGCTLLLQGTVGAGFLGSLSGA